MSFILDALRKSQMTRRQQQSPMTVAVEEARRAPQPHNWWALVIAIVILNLAVVLGFIYWMSRSPEDTEQQVTELSDAGATSTPAVQIAKSEAVGASRTSATGNSVAAPASASEPERREVKPLSSEVRKPQVSVEKPAGTAVQEPRPASDTPSAPVIQPPSGQDPDFLPTLAELQLDKRIALSPLHVDVHVYNENPQRRFVLINSRKYREGERLSEGPLLETIRRDGLVMYYRGQRFLLPRE